MRETPQVTAARIEVERRRAELIDTARELQLRLQPRTLASEAWEKAKMKGADLAEDAVDAVASRPVAVGGVAAAIALFLAREPVRDAAVKIYDAMTSKDEPKAKAPALKARKTPARTPARRPARKPAAAARKTEKAT